MIQDEGLLATDQNLYLDKDLRCKRLQDEGLLATDQNLDLDET